ncbi:MAG: hypothetical protein KVP17_000930 [Porospora cf. gigantea B]|uniref:uncharacterized protein n=1 Tax=Porospora cf. gigantea B TaxID=2853592 RepID=UPI003571BAFE|nr:MAG: hypothetical protein KVP17_000930 [Porospora cf. gigantea B]
MRISKEKSTDAHTALIGSAALAYPDLSANGKRLICDEPTPEDFYMNVFYSGTPTQLKGLTAHVVGGQPVLMNSEAVVYADPRNLEIGGQPLISKAVAHADPRNFAVRESPVASDNPIEYASIDHLHSDMLTEALKTHTRDRRDGKLVRPRVADDALAEETVNHIKHLQNRQEQLAGHLLQTDSAVLEKEYKQNERVLMALTAKASKASPYPLKRQPFRGLYDNDNVFDNTETEELKGRLKDQNAQMIDSLQAELTNINTQIRSNKSTSILPAAKRKRKELKRRKREIEERIVALGNEYE